ncbi:hypothetical protein E1A91_A06G203900v1 [Gossypium mustelinum]|uniref:Pectate lyase superfamily protein domain-containing protein n=1 Tax=Gossypium mustelinum TaxID=34275 RepID=A0A5D2Z2H2_GOSMU|nr:hypothetical protein E1A91_A06G203900v1 [Gossypium mustelinum]
MKNLGLILYCSSCSTWNIIVFICSFMLMHSNVVVHAESFEFDSLLQLPKSGSSARIRPRAKQVLSVSDFGAKGDGYLNDTRAFENAWNVACSSPGRIRIVIPAGYTYLVHPVELGGHCKSKITLMISGTIVAPKNPNVWDGLNPRKWLYFHEVKHLHVVGGGTINGMGQQWWARSCKRKKTNPCRHAPTALTFHKLIAPSTSPNTDGIHISSSHGVEVKNSVVRTGDDCVSIVGNTSRVQIRNFVCGPGHGISIGSLGKSNSWAQVRNVLVDGAFISNTENGVRIKTWQGGSGYASDMKFMNILMENVAYPIIIDQYYCDSDLPCANQTLAVKVDNISYVHIKGTSAVEEAIRFACSDSLTCEGLYLEDIQLVSITRGITKSFCWEAYGSSSGLVQPAPCLTCSDGFIKQKVPYGLPIGSF